MAEPVRHNCSTCGAGIVWHGGNGGQWIGAHPPRDWVSCYGIPEGPKHRPFVPPLDRPELIKAWLEVYP